MQNKTPTVAPLPGHSRGSFVLWVSGMLKAVFQAQKTIVMFVTVAPLDTTTLSAREAA